MHLQCTSIEQELVLLFPIPFQARHSYLPDSLRMILLKTRVLLYVSIVLDLALIHAMLGTGLPMALQWSVTLSPSVTGLGHCCDVTLGWSVNYIFKWLIRDPNTALEYNLHASLDKTKNFLTMSFSSTVIFLFWSCDIGHVLMTSTSCWWSHPWKLILTK